MSFAKTFIKQLREGKTNEAINTISSAMKEGTDTLVEKTKVDVLTGYGFSIKEEEEKEKEEESEDKDKEKESEDKDKETKDTDEE